MIPPPPDPPLLLRERRGPSILVGILATLLFHALLFVLSPLFFGSLSVNASGRHQREPSLFEVELEPPAPAEEKAPAPFRFVEVNPDAPDNPPDKTENVGAQNQQVAQEVPTPDGKSERPAIEGQKEIPSNQIVSGQLSEPQPPPMPPQAETPPVEAQAAAAPRPAESPLSGFEKFEGKEADAIGSNVARVSTEAPRGPEPVEGVAGAPLTPWSQAIDPQNPQPRLTLPRTPQNVRPAIFEDNPLGTARFGKVAFNSVWNNYGAYLQRLIDAVQLRWEGFLLRSRLSPAPGTHVIVKFVLQRDGRIAVPLVSVDGTAGEPGTIWCVAAITPDPDFSYGPWTDDMVAILGERQELTFTFYYR